MASMRSRRSCQAKNHQMMNVGAEVSNGMRFLDDEEHFSFLWQVVPRACIEHVVVELFSYDERLKRAVGFDLRYGVIAHRSNPDFQHVGDGL